MEFSRQEYWSGLLPFPSPGDLPNPGIKPRSPALEGRFFTIWTTREYIYIYIYIYIHTSGKRIRRYMCICETLGHLDRSYCLKLFVSYFLWSHGLYSPWNSPGQNTGVGGHSILQGIFPTQGLNPGPPHCRWILYQLSHREALKPIEVSYHSFKSIVLDLKTKAFTCKSETTSEI